MRQTNNNGYVDRIVAIQQPQNLTAEEKRFVECYNYEFVQYFAAQRSLNETSARLIACWRDYGMERPATGAGSAQ